ncbi:hypothetical protein [Dokdonella sp.]|uniref:hypothetical protein n=1 Tax=Dokdonella sp. TaxID=2291710 RepID=UPI001B1859AC|nr:hypothetical protein [Dokdonella sp.]MBO9662425.1 hypothetical protein [Dokdonella sp.]
MLVLVAGCATTQPTQAPSAGPGRVQPAAEPVPPEYRAAIGASERVGLDVYRRDHAASRTTDVLLQLPGAPSLQEGAGWLTQDVGNGVYRVVYLLGRKEDLRAWAEADYHVSSDSIVDPHLISPPRPLSPDETPLARAVQTAMSAEWLRCAERYNVVTRPAGGEDASIHVYLLPARMEGNSFPQSGFHDFAVSADGSAIVDHYSQTKACLRSTASPPSGGKLHALMATHLTSPVPTAFHVFMSLDYGMPVYAVTVDNGLLWSIDQGHIRSQGKVSRP